MCATTSTRPLWAGGRPLGAHTRRRKALLLAQHAQAQRSTNHKSPVRHFGCFAWLRTARDLAEE